MWFEKLTGFREGSPENVRAKLSIDGDAFISGVNNRRFTFGKLEIVSLESLRQYSPANASGKGSIKVTEVVGDVQKLHAQPSNANALFQAASQFNLLEMMGPDVTPEEGIDIYEDDRTQGPACAIACGAGTIYRNYFIEVGGQTGQTADRQVDCLELIGKELQNDELQLWTMENGYAMFGQEGLETINNKLSAMTDEQRELLKGKLMVGIQWNTEVTISGTGHKVSQVYCSALPVAYCEPEPHYFERFARLVLEATYEATMYAGLINLERNGSNIVYLTLVDGGAFGNEPDWIFDSIKKAIQRFRNVPLDVRIVSFGGSDPDVLHLIEEVK